jgi:porin
MIGQSTSSFSRNPLRAPTSLVLNLLLIVVMAAPAAAQVVATAPLAGQAQGPGNTQLAQPTSTLQEMIRRDRLFGTWGGAQTRMRENGTKLDVSLTQFFDWAPTQSSLDEPTETKYHYGGKIDVRDISDISRYTWDGLSVDGHLEIRFGDVPLLAGGTLLPTNTALVFPEPEDTKARLSGLTFTQVLNPHVSVSIGRFNMLDRYSNRMYTGGAGIDRFMNMAFVRNPISVRTVPPVAEGAIFSIMRGGQVVATGGLIESTDEGFFKNGATVLWDVNLPIKPFSLPGTYTIGGEFSSTQGTALDQNFWLLIPPGSEVTPVTEQGAWTLHVTVDQALVADQADPNRHFGAFATLGFSDGNPSPIQPFAIIGVGGNSLLRGRDRDTFGVGYFFTGVSNTFRDSIQPLRLRDEQGGELYYNAAVTGWSYITANLQFVDPFAVGSKTRTFFAIRWKLVF